MIYCQHEETTDECIALCGALGSKERIGCRPIRGESHVAPPVTAHEAYP
jgi:hypothetical protein